jgi:hypothetical protein
MLPIVASLQVNSSVLLADFLPAEIPAEMPAIQAI